ncbi:protein PALS1 isoform X2 [Neocloeon triangulifer]|uniref:protein PALS1 isoform X2 n=1 Tax=Neocloeon triangulifer TaxID=2078957 RepID=UPI00286F1F13|nr:protein PALS1 isoform X2 [Neocloeon triangulifer]
MVDLGGYVIILVETKDKKIKLYGSPADKADLEVGDEILEVNGRSLEDESHTEVISHIHQCIRSRTICLRVKRRSGNRLALDLAQNSNVQDAFVIAVEQQARERLERLSALKRIKPVDMTKLSQQLNQIPTTSSQQELNGFIESSPIYVTSLPQQQNTSIAPSDPESATCTAKVNGHHLVSEDSRGEEIELKQELGGTSTPRSVSRSPYHNGRTEKLIGSQDVSPTPSCDLNKVRTTAIVERTSVNRSPIPDTARRRSVTEQQQASQEESFAARQALQAQTIMMNMVAEYELELQQHGGPHREMAVDVPDTFIARTKTPPRYPPPKHLQAPNTNGTAAPAASAVPGKPVPPPRDHLRIEKDGRLVNRAPPPQVPARAVPVPPPVIAASAAEHNSSDRTPTREQMESIRKYQEDLRRRKENEDRVAQEKEFLRSSMRDSRKLQALESRPPPKLPSGIVNDGYSSTEDNDGVVATTDITSDSLHKIVTFSELAAALQRLGALLRKHGRGMEAQVAAVQTLLLSAEFGRALALHNKVCATHKTPTPLPTPTCADSQTVVRDCLEALQPCAAPGAAELAEILTRYELEGLLTAHDILAKRLPGPTPPRMPSPPAEETIPVAPPYTDDNIKIVKIEKTNEPLGATVRNEGDSVVIGRIVKGGAAEKSGLLREGDEVLEVNGVEMRGKSVNEVCDLLASMTGTLTFLVVPNREPRAPQPPARETLLHMKAHFDYDPEDDPYIPCRELGISFQKGDILHIISQEDPNWWQAYREGEEDQTLAGLVPSRAFQHQREAMKQNIIEDKGTKDKNKKGGTLLCAKKNTKKKKKKMPYSANYNDDYEADEILTYEDVALYYPKANHKRPIVLIGPPNIGRHELRQRLMEDSERFAAAIPHTSRPKKDGEADGQDYHFISRAQFEADIVSRKFVEHGEYERAYYGTSLEAIRGVVSSSKICVLNLHPQSLKILRTSDLKPYVVFVAPPSLEKLRQKKLRNGETFREEELKEIIEKAREMEDRYGHFFDMVIINNDTERAYQQLLNEINELEREPQWVPATWVKAV